MIIGGYPNCGNVILNELDNYSSWYKIKCEEYYWLHNSKINPMSITEEKFKEFYEIKNGKVKPKFSDEKELINLLAENADKKIVEELERDLLEVIFETKLNPY